MFYFHNTPAYFIICSFQLNFYETSFGAELDRIVNHIVPDVEHQAFVASVFNLPLAAKCADMVLCIFAPIAAEQFRRVLRRDGHLLCVVPLEQHLWELKQAVYDKPILNPSEPPAPDGFTLVDSRDVHYTLSLGGDDVRSLFAMTPYMYKTSARDQAKLAELDRLDTQVHFGIRIYSPTAGRG